VPIETVLCCSELGRVTLLDGTLLESMLDGKLCSMASYSMVNISMTRY
jgi:hypothetical protein